MPKPITARGFRGMNNLPDAPAHLMDDERRITPTIALNVEVTDGGVLLKRHGFARKVVLVGCHSMWAGSVMLCVAGGELCRVEGVAVSELCGVTGPSARVNYAEIDSLVYMSNPYWTGVYDRVQDAVRPWGVSLPPAPDIGLVAGDLPPGRYSLCYTTIQGDFLSGNGPIMQVAWEGMAQGIQLKNLGDDHLCWITHPNGGDLFLADVDGLDQITGQAPSIERLPTLGVNPPPGFTHFRHAFGRIWGASGRKLLYSEPFQYEWFKAGNFLPFLEDLVLVAPVSEGLFVNSMRSTWFLGGTNPAKMTINRIGDGAIPGTLAMTQLEGGGYEISKKATQLPTPVWLSKHGFVAGTHSGHLVHLTEARLKLLPRSQGVAFYRVKNGIPQIIASLGGHPLKAEGDDLQEIFTNGRLFVPKPLAVIGNGGVTISN